MGPLAIQFASVATAFPAVIHAASAWDFELIRQRGTAMGENITNNGTVTSAEVAQLYTLESAPESSVRQLRGFQERAFSEWHRTEAPFYHPGIVYRI
ncbi:hypothetical protein GX50_03831 [[Emmonsia] crescens]|uniref:beta-glucosidase n=1 Tax=[Emmonsia] crescens TaxID=73230 RepID=A0A2B7ZA94_9EURO|nr:hypothetical protein GX50_03831 [Emmonsia crescens]